MAETELRFDKEDLEAALEVLRKGGVIVYPTDTVWGIGCDATNDEACKKIYQLKKRADSKSMLLLVSDYAQLERTVKYVPEAAEMLIEAAVRPLTIIYDHPVGVANSLLASDGSVGIRIANDKFVQTLCRKLRKPIVSTSANLSGEPAARNFKEISAEILNGADYVVNFRRNENCTPSPSNIIKVADNGVIKVIR